MLTALLGLVWNLTRRPPELLTDNPKASLLDRTVDAAVTEFFRQPGHIGLALSVYDNGSVSYYGYADSAQNGGKLPNRTSLFEIASITKTFTGALAAKALLAGKMTLDGDFRTYLSSPYPNLEKEGKPITLRTLATHTSGLPKDIPDSDALFAHPDFDKLPYQLIENEKGYDDARYLKELHEAKLSSVPGEKQKYSNIGIKLIGFGLQSIYEQSLSQLFHDEITGPLGMAHTALSVSNRDKPRLMQGYGPSGKPMPYHLLNAGAAGGLYSSSEDLVKYMRWQLDESDAVVKRSHALISGDIAKFGEGLIWDETTTKDGERKLWHSGGAYGMASQLILFPEANVGIVLLANDGGFNTQGELNALAMAIRSSQKKPGH